MPTYEYKCNACGARMDIFQSMRDKPKRTCPECGKNALERLIGTGAAVLFKGSGFYQTDYRSESYKKAAKSESSAPAGAAAPSAAGDAKPAPSPAPAAKPAAAKSDKPKPSAGAGKS